MELYHRTLIKPSIISQAISAHLIPINPKEEQEKPKQILITKTNSFELYHYAPTKPNQKC